MNSKKSSTYRNRARFTRLPSFTVAHIATSRAPHRRRRRCRVIQRRFSSSLLHARGK